MTVLELYHRLSAAIPAALSAQWDNDGLACCPDATREVRRVLVALDPTEAVVKKAIGERFDVILTHHPLLFRGVRSLTEENAVSRKLLALSRHGITAMSFHTRLDALTGGVNDTLAECLGLISTRPFGTSETGELGRVGKLKKAVPAREFASVVAEKLGTDAVLFAGEDKKIKTVAVVGGEGGDLLDAAREAGADLFLSGRIGYHKMLDAAEDGLAVIEAGHFASEVPVLSRLVDLVRRADETIACERFDAPTISLVLKERQGTV